MKVLLVHNYYQQPGGEDRVFEAEGKLLERHGHTVWRYTAHNDDAERLSKVSLAKKTIWNAERYEEVRTLLRRTKPHVVHVHNTFPLISPSVYHASKAENVPVVQSLHNPRLLCPSANFYRSGQLCTRCLGKGFAWPGVLHRCYHDSAVHSLGVASMTAFHRLKGTWSEAVDRYIVFTEFYKRLFIQGGLPADKIALKPHFLYPDPGMSDETPRYALYIGRLDPEKGVQTLLQAWRQLKHSGVALTLKIRGEGQLLPELKAAAHREGLDIEFVGRLSDEELIALLKGAYFLLWPSRGFYETFGLVAAEALACGVPVIASAVGVATSMIQDGKTGLHFQPGDPDDLARQVTWALSHPLELASMKKEARRDYTENYTAEENYRQLMAIYEGVRR